MHLEGQAGERGYAMAAVLISVAIMSIVMTALLPVGRQQMQREKEAELAFRGEQYARAIYLFQRSNGGMNPPSIDALEQGRYLRKKWKDPTNGEDFLPLALGVNQPGVPGGAAGQRGGAPQRGAEPGGQRGGQPSPGLGGTQPGGVRGGGGIATVVSQNKAASIRIYNGASHYNEWRFLYNARGQRGNPQGPQTGPGGPGQGGPGMPGTGPGRRGGPGQRGGPGMGGPGRRGGGPSRGSATLPGRGRSGGGS
jgi:type II secretory pathway pseudopilin PulG